MTFLSEIELESEEKTRKGLIATSLAMILVSHSIEDDLVVSGLFEGMRFTRDGILTALSFLLFLFLIRISTFSWVDVYKGSLRRRYKEKLEELGYEYGYQVEEDLSDIPPDKEYELTAKEISKERDFRIIKVDFWAESIFKDFIPMIIALYCAFKFDSFQRVFIALYEALGVSTLLEIARSLFS